MSKCGTIVFFWALLINVGLSGETRAAITVRYFHAVPHCPASPIRMGTKVKLSGSHKARIYNSGLRPAVVTISFGIVDNRHHYNRGSRQIRIPGKTERTFGPSPTAFETDDYSFGLVSLHARTEVSSG